MASATLIQRSIVDPKLEWKVSLVKESPIDRASAHFNPLAARAKLVAAAGAGTGRYLWGAGVTPPRIARTMPTGRWPASPATCRGRPRAAAAICRSRRTGRPRATNMTVEETRNFATYNPQVARDEMFQLGKHMTTKGNETAPIRSTSALVLSSTNVNRERIYVQQPPISADRLFQPGVRAALPAYGPQDRNQEVHRLPPIRPGRQQCDHGPAQSAGNQLRQFRRHERLGRRWSRASPRSA